MKVSLSFPLFHSTKKTVIVDTGKGLDQLGHEIGMPQPGDVVKCHIKASYSAPVPLPFGKKILRKKEFLDTSTIGETCFYEVTIPAKTNDQETTTTARDIITGWIQTMTLGEVAKFKLDLNQLQDDDREVKWLFVTKRSSSSSSSSMQPLMHRSQFAHVPETIQQVTFQISLFRMIRKQKEHRRKVQNTPGGFYMPV